MFWRKTPNRKKKKKRGTADNKKASVFFVVFTVVGVKFLNLLSLASHKKYAYLFEKKKIFCHFQHFLSSKKNKK